MKKKKIKIISNLGKEIKRFDLKLLVVCMFISFFVAYVGSSFIVIDSWYESIKPSIAPPNFVFPIVWTILFLLIGLAFYHSWGVFGKNKKERNNINILYSINFAFNIAWSFFFFTLHNSISALFVIVLLILSIISLIAVNWKKARIASYLLIPYLIWVLFAMLLNILVIINIMR